MQLPGSAAIPAPYRDRQEIAYRTGKRIVDMVHEDLKPSDILTKDNFINTIVVNSAIGGSTNAPIHVNAIARHIGVELEIDDWQTHGHKVPLLVNLQPAGEYLGEDYYHAGGVPAVVNELMKHGLIRENAPTVNGKTIGENCRDTPIQRREGHPPVRQPAQGGGRLPGAARQSVRQRHHEDQRDRPEFSDRYLTDPKNPDALRGQGRGVRRARGLPPPDRRSGAGDRRAHAAVHARRRADRLSGRGRGGQHAAAGLPDQAGHPLAGLHRRRPAVGDLGLALDPQRLAGSGGRRQPRHPQDRRPGAHRPQQGRRPTS